MTRWMKLNPLNRIFFIAGNIFPDFNPLSYLIRSGKNKLGGHNYSSRKAFIKNIEKHPCHGPLSWFIAGEKLHYLADAFTRPHNHQFECSSKSHTAYEHELHKYFVNTIHHKLRPDSVIRPDKFPQWLENIHRKYIQSNPGISRDCEYILHVYPAACKILCTDKKLRQRNFPA